MGILVENEEEGRLVELSISNSILDAYCQL